MSAFERLGLKPTQDEREIKRAYARELRRTRPDEDPAGFQALNEAYRQCLAYAEYQREQASLDDEPEASGGDEFAAPADESGDDVDAEWPSRGDDASQAESTARYRPAAAASEPAGQSSLSFDLHAFLDELLQRARTQSPAELKRWLLDLEPLYSLDLTRALRGPVAQAASQAEPALSPQALATVFDFFTLNVVGPNDGWLLEQAHQAQHRAESTRAFELALAKLRSPQARPVDRLLLRELLEPEQLGRRLIIALIAGLPTRLIEMASTLRQLDPQLAAQRLNLGTVEFWHQICDRGRLHWRRAFVVLARIVLYPSLLLGAIAALGQRTDVLGALPSIWWVAAASWLSVTVVQAWAHRRALRPRPASREPPLPIDPDGPLWLFGALTVVALFLMPIASEFALLIVSVMGLIWLIARGRRLMGRTFVAMLSGALAASCLPSCLDALLGVRGDTDPPAAWMPFFVLIGVATPVLQDLHHARRHRISLRAAREQAAWLWPAMIAAMAALVVSAWVTN
ncbi:MULTISPECIES: J domain-containing protein [unclassified Lysobacter]|uniref:J domain-containing protein n=1 Tax=unclassified Lysobacter TaxID=2635362 RepID=UPI001BE850B4|nr:MULTISPECIES: J domain-containing protein [unclassified Lysobacter]MBT2746477.1 hypothetical protein [Lysobacter sp. ISL-42]MBT2752979.1 hypothetical protein [Lysobacter sp. ISL-50]MBT2777656.1 hypothetical protein [Lysobacter sp. ISL-54]MBT2782427.1 hypothetical protein [Lysobacter sp. ISL-52]